MAYSLQDQVYVELYFNGLEFPFNQVNSFDFIHIVESTMLQLPMLTISLKDGEQWLIQNGALADATLIKVVFGSGTLEGSKLSTVEFRLASKKREPGPAADTYLIEALLDAPKYLAATLKDPVKGSSSDVLKKVADTCGFTFSGVGTSDQQIWYPGNKTINSFAKYVAERGYATENSCMMIAVTTDKTLVYRDITSMDNPVGSFGILDMSGRSGYPAVSYKPSTNSGVENIRAGYAGAVVEQNLLDAESINTKHSAIGTVVNEQGQLMVNSEVKSSINEGNVRFGPISPGNAHENSQSARYQNSRVQSLFSSQFELVTPVMTPFHITDCTNVITTLLEESNASASAWKGLYRIATKVIYITQGHYAERFSLLRRTVNSALAKSASTASAPLKRTASLPAPVASAASLIPLSFSFLTDAIAQATSTITGSISSAGAGASLGAARTLTALTGATVPDIRGSLSGVAAGASSLVSTATGTITGILASDPTDSMGAAAAVAATATSDITSAVESPRAAIESVAPQAARAASSALGAASSLGSLASSFPGLGGAIPHISAALSMLSPPSFASIVSAAGLGSLASVSSAISSAQSAVSGAVDSLSSTASDISNQATNASSILTTTKDSSIASVTDLLP
jgi:hypothetical protein